MNLVNPQSISALMPALGWMLFSAGLLTIGDVVFRVWLNQQFSFGFWAVLLVYVVGIFCLMLSFFGEHIAIAGAICIIANSVIYLVVAYLIYGDTISPWQMVGMVLGIAAIFAMQLGGK